MFEYMNGLNKEQIYAVEAIDGHVLIIAGAGTGKTTTLIARTSFMLEAGVNPENILLLTFTNKSAKDMQLKIAKNIGGEAAEKITATTFHSFCANFLRKYADLVGIKNSFTILDSPDCLDILDIVYDEVGISDDDFPAKKKVLNMYSTSVNSRIALRDVVYESGEHKHLAQIMLVTRRYELYKKEHNMMDYDDLLYFTNKILSEHEDIREAVDARYKYISCDEYQDTNTLQDSILSLMSQDYKNLAVVGDDNQSIYAFRCAEIDNILNFTDTHVDCSEIILRENYRSSQEILDFSNSIMSHATEGIEKNLKGQFSDKKPTLYIASGEDEETEYVLSEIRKYHKSGLSYKNIAVIVRNGYQSFRLEAKLNSIGIPYKKFGGIKFLEKEVIKDILAYLKISVNPQDQLAFFRILKKYPGIGTVTAKKICAKVDELGISCLNTLYPKKAFNKSLCELKDLIEELEILNLEGKLRRIIEFYTDVIKVYLENSKTKYLGDKKAKYKDDIKEAEVLISMASGYHSAKKYLEDLVLEATVPETDGDYLNITTIHSAKGLEYEVVFVMGCVDGVFPKCNLGSPQDSEELRCMYVACTRAKKRLHLSAPQRIFYRGSWVDAPLSHFINYSNVIKTLEIQGQTSLLNRMRNARLY